MHILARVDYNLRIDHTIMQAMLAYLDTILADPGVYLTRLYRTWSTHYITNHVGTDVLEALVSGRRWACWNARPIRSETPSSLVEPAQSEFIQRYYSQLIGHSIKKGHRRMAWDCRIRWDDYDRTHSDVIALTHDELTGQWNVTIIEPDDVPAVRPIDTPTLYGVTDPMYDILGMCHHDSYEQCVHTYQACTVSYTRPDA
jgi:hypothetical protein